MALKKIALIGNPNSGKSTLFNVLTGLNQSVSNFPGVTVDKKSGVVQVNGDEKVLLTDMPGTYSVFPNSEEERIVVNSLLNNQDENYPDFIVYVADITQLARHILLATQIRDLGFPMIFVLNMADIINSDIESIDTLQLEKFLGVPTISISARDKTNIAELKNLISKNLKSQSADKNLIYTFSEAELTVIKDIKKSIKSENDYQLKLWIHHYEWLNFLSSENKHTIAQSVKNYGFKNIAHQVYETMARYSQIEPLIKKITIQKISPNSSVTDRLDNVITHKIWGPLIFTAIMFFIFQAIFAWAQFPMEMIEKTFGVVGDFVESTLGESWLSNLIVNGLLAGLSGVLVFIPQIAILFLLIGLLEESGYMSRVVYMFDGLMQKFGMNGRSMVSLISSGACAIPAIMATRTISNPKEKLITILVSPLISCSARLPVYAVLVGFVVPDETVFGVFNLQGIAFMGLYVLGIVGALASAYVFKLLLKSNQPSSLLLELPIYKKPIWSNVWITVKDKVWTFITEAGKIIIIISMLLWFLASFGPDDRMEKAEASAQIEAQEMAISDTDIDNYVASKKMENSYVGILGKAIEPAITPLGYDWKIGIALLTSFAAREVFVGTMATIYSLSSDSDEDTVKGKMAAELRPGTNRPMYDRPTALSLLVFYVFAMQCMSTLAVTQRETNTWKWPIIQFLFMSVMAYVGAWVAYNLF